MNMKQVLVMNNLLLRAMEPEDYKITYKWRQDDATSSAVIGMKRFISLETEKKWVLKAIENHEAGKALRLVICSVIDSTAVGLVNVTDIDLINRCCRVGYMIDPEARGGGVATWALTQAIEYMIENFGMNRVSCRILEDNIPSQRLAVKVGMQQEGTLRKAVFKDNQYKDLICFAVLKEEFEEAR